MNVSNDQNYTEALIDKFKYNTKRFTRKEKEQFLQLVEHELSGLGYETRRISKNGLIKNVHLETINNDPDIIFIAHYDTGVLLPFWAEGVMRISGITRTWLQLLIIISLFQLLNLLAFPVIEKAVTYLFYASLISFFIPNTNNLNDNTSGVITLLAMAEKLKKYPDINVKFVFTDNEENMLAGSFNLKKMWKKEGFSFKDKKIISVDCVGRGNTPLISYNLNGSLAKDLHEILSKGNNEVKKVNMWLTPFSDAYPFRKQGAVNINMSDKSLIPGGYYLKNIHSLRDKDVSVENMLSIQTGLLNYCKQLQKDTAAKTSRCNN